MTRGRFAPPLSTVQAVNGAIAAFYPGVLERIYRMIGEEYYVAFASIYNVHIHPVSGKHRLKSMQNTWQARTGS